jgi:hypothetical protein
MLLEAVPVNFTDSDLTIQGMNRTIVMFGKWDTSAASGKHVALVCSPASVRQGQIHVLLQRH